MSKASEIIQYSRGLHISRGTCLGKDMSRNVVRHRPAVHRAALYREYYHIHSSTGTAGTLFLLTSQTGVCKIWPSRERSVQQNSRALSFWF